MVQLGRDLVLVEKIWGQVVWVWENLVPVEKIWEQVEFLVVEGVGRENRVPTAEEKILESSEYRLDQEGTTKGRQVPPVEVAKELVVVGRQRMVEVLAEVEKELKVVVGLVVEKKVAAEMGLMEEVGRPTVVVMVVEKGLPEVVMAL